METKTSPNGLMAHFTDDDSARAFLESQRWPDGPVCPHCGVVNEAFRMQSKPDSKNKMRPGLWKCKPCRKTFTVTVASIFEDTRIPLSKWLMAMHYLCASKKGMSAHQLHRMLGVTYKTAWFMAHRIRHAMKKDGIFKPMTGTVEVDETYIGGRRKNTKPGRPSRDSHKAPVVSLVQRGGEVRSFAVDHVTGANLREVMQANIVPEANVMTDDFKVYRSTKHHFPNHDIIKHTQGKYARTVGNRRIHTNTVEGYFSLLKRGIVGTFHHVSKQHLHRYLSEFDFRYNARFTSDVERSLMALSQIGGKRLMYRDSISHKTV
jgi:transposase-like protein